MSQIFNIITIITVVIMVALILAQNRGASLGAGFGGSSELHTTRRGVDKTIHQITIIVSILFVLSIVFGALVAS